MAIETIFNRVIVSFTDTVFRVEQIMHEGESHFWTALEIKVTHFEYHDAHASSDNKTMFEELASRSTKKVLLNDVEILVDRCVVTSFLDIFVSNKTSINVLLICILIVANFLFKVL